MKLNALSPALGSKPKRQRVGRGIGSGLGKTCGKGHKGQKSRSGGFHHLNFEGGQMPIHRRLPKMGFKSRTQKFNDEINLSELMNLGSDVIDINTLKEHGIINKCIRSVKVIQSGEITVPVKLKGIRVTKGARSLIEQVGGSIE